MSVMIKRKEMG